MDSHDTHTERESNRPADEDKAGGRNALTRQAAGDLATPEPQLWDLPIFGWAWREDGRDLRA